MAAGTAGGGAAGGGVLPMACSCSLMSRNGLWKGSSCCRFGDGGGGVRGFLRLMVRILG